MLLIFGLFLAALAFGLNLLLSRTPGGGTGALTGPQNVPAVVAAKDIPPATQITSDMVTIQDFSSTQWPPFAFRTTSQVLGKYSAIDIHQGQALADNLIVADQSGVAPAKEAYLPIPKGFVAMQIPTGELVGAGGYIQPDDRIDVLATLGSTTNVAFTNLHVLRVGPAGSPDTRGISSSLTVLVTLQQAEDLTFLLSNTSYKYVLKSVQDYDQPDAPTVGVTLNSFKAQYHFQ